MILNDVPEATRFPEETRRRVLESAKSLGYRPNYFARSLGKKRSFLIGAIAGVIVVLAAVPQTRRRLTGIVWPHLRSIGPRLLDAIAHPLRLALSMGANLVLTAAYLVAFIAALWAIGAHPAILPAAPRSARPPQGSLHDDC